MFSGEKTHTSDMCFNLEMLLLIWWFIRTPTHFQITRTKYREFLYYSLAPGKIRWHRRRFLV